jgi:hypothetical protein
MDKNTSNSVAGGLVMVNMFCTLIFYARYVLPWNEKRKCLVRLYDGIHEFLPVLNTTPVINTLEYFCYIHYLLALFYWQTVNIYLTCLSFTLLIYARISMISVCPLLVPPNAKPLIDMSQKIILGNIPFFENDLFFSGHIAGIMTLGFTVGYPEASYYYYWVAFFQGICMLFSKVHYTVDILVAPYVAFGSYTMAEKLCEILPL